MLIDETWRFSPEQEQRIKDALGVGSNAAERPLAAVLGAAQLYRSWKASESNRPNKGEVSRRLKDIAEKCSVLKHSIAELDSSSLDYLQERYDTVAVLKPIRHVLWSELILALGCLWSAAWSFDPRGRPPDEAMGVFVNLLALIWEDTHGKWPKRAYDAYKRRDAGRFHRFVEVCLRAVDPNRPRPDRVIRKVLEGRRLMDKNPSLQKPPRTRRKRKRK